MYADPPYTGFKDESCEFYLQRYGLPETEHWVKTAQNWPNYIVVTNNLTPTLRQLYGDHGFTLAGSYMRPGTVSAGDRKPIQEGIWVRPAI